MAEIGIKNLSLDFSRLHSSSLIGRMCIVCGSILFSVSGLNGEKLD